MVARIGREGTTGGRPVEWWRAPIRRSWSGGEFRRRSWRRRRPRGMIGVADPHGGARCIGDQTVAFSLATLGAMA
jgi:hypothetical protein